MQDEIKLNFEAGSQDTYPDIFDAVPEPETRSYFKFEKIGDGVQGTYVGRDDNTVNGYGMPQTLVSLKQPDGTVKTVSIRHSKVGLIKILDTCKLGEIIGFKFTGEKPNVGKQPTKFIRLAHDPKIVDRAWLDGQGVAVAVATKPVAVAKAVDNNEDKIRQVIALAKTKLGATDETSIRTLIMEKTGLAMININLNLIEERLKSL